MLFQILLVVPLSTNMLTLNISGNNHFFGLNGLYETDSLFLFAVAASSSFADRSKSFLPNEKNNGKCELIL